MKLKISWLKILVFLKKYFRFNFFLDKILERGEKIELLVTKTKTMSNLSDTFKKQVYFLYFH